MHAIKILSKDIDIETIALFQPTSPLRKAHHIKQAFNKFTKHNFDSLISVSGIDSKYLKLFFELKKGYLTSINIDFPFMPRQELPRTFLPNGAIYLSSCRSFIKHKGFYSNNLGFYEMTKEDSLDIDTMTDLKAISKLKL